MTPGPQVLTPPLDLTAPPLTLHPITPLTADKEREKRLRSVKTVRWGRLFSSEAGSVMGGLLVSRDKQQLVGNFSGSAADSRVATLSQVSGRRLAYFTFAI